MWLEVRKDVGFGGCVRYLWNVDLCGMSGLNGLTIGELDLDWCVRVV